MGIWGFLWKVTFRAKRRRKNLAFLGGVWAFGKSSEEEETHACGFFASYQVWLATEGSGKPGA